MTEEFLTWTPAEVCRLLRLGRNAVYGGIRSGQIPSVKVGRRLLVPREALNSILANSAQRKPAGG